MNLCHRFTYRQPAGNCGLAFRIVVWHSCCSRRPHYGYCKCACGLLQLRARAKYGWNVPR